MNEIALAVQAMSACDRLEQGVKDGDKESMERVQEMISKFASKEAGEEQSTLARAFRYLMKKCSEGGPQELAVAMMAIRCLTEQQLALAFKQGGDDPEAELNVPRQ